MTDLASFTRVSTAAATGIADRLVRCGYLLRVLDPSDRRIIRVKPTLKGLELVKKINRQRREMVTSIFGRLSQSEREEYLSILTRINDLLTRDEEALRR
jgi:DNA-binding MarR family transcriptional regulator